MHGYMVNGQQKDELPKAEHIASSQQLGASSDLARDG